MPGQQNSPNLYYATIQAKIVAWNYFSIYRMSHWYRDNFSTCFTHSNTSHGGMYWVSKLPQYWWLIQYILLILIEKKKSHFRHCVCRRDGCDHGDICQKNSDCGRDKWNRKGKCVGDFPNKNSFLELFGDINGHGNEYAKKHGPWRKHK